MRWLPNITIDAIWHALQTHWTVLRLSRPGIVAHQAGSQFMTLVFQASSELLRIDTNSVNHGILIRLGFPTDRPTRSMCQYTAALCKATQEMTTHFSRAKISGATEALNGLDTIDVRKAPFNTLLLLCQPEIVE